MAKVFDPYSPTSQEEIKRDQEKKKKNKERKDKVKKAVEKSKVGKAIQKKLMSIAIALGPFLFFIILVACLFDVIFYSLGFGNAPDYCKRTIEVENSCIIEGIKQREKEIGGFKDSISQYFLCWEGYNSPYSEFKPGDAPSTSTGYLVIGTVDKDGNRSWEYKGTTADGQGGTKIAKNNLPTRSLFGEVYSVIDKQYKIAATDNPELQYYVVNDIKEDVIKSGKYYEILAAIVQGTAKDDVIKFLIAGVPGSGVKKEDVNINEHNTSIFYQWLENQLGLTYGRVDTNVSVTNINYAAEYSEQYEWVGGDAELEDYYYLQGANQLYYKNSKGEWLLRPKEMLTKGVYDVKNPAIQVSDKDGNISDLTEGLTEEEISRRTRILKEYLSSSDNWEIKNTKVVTPEETEKVLVYNIDADNKEDMPEYQNFVESLEEKQFKKVLDEKSLNQAIDMLQFITGTGEYEKNYEQCIVNQYTGEVSYMPMKLPHAEIQSFNSKYYWRDYVEDDPQKAAAKIERQTLPTVVIYNYLTETCKFSKEAACVIMGAMDVKSGMNPFFEDRNGGLGLFGWEGNKSTELDAQLALFATQVINGQDIAAYKVLTSEKTMYEIVDDFIKVYTPAHELNKNEVSAKAKYYFDNIEALKASGGTTALGQKLTSSEIDAYMKLAVSNGLKPDSVTYKFLLSALEKVGKGYDQNRRESADYYDCSSLVYRCAKEAGFPAMYPYTYSGTTYTIKDIINQKECANHKSDPMPGDIILWRGHVAIYMGGGVMVHAGSENTGVCVTSYTTELKGDVFYGIYNMEELTR